MKDKGLACVTVTENTGDSGKIVVTGVVTGLDGWNVLQTGET